jgi:hypothetical protein
MIALCGVAAVLGIESGSIFAVIGVVEVRQNLTARSAASSIPLEGT